MAKKQYFSVDENGEIIDTVFLEDGEEIPNASFKIAWIGSFQSPYWDSISNSWKEKENKEEELILEKERKKIILSEQCSFEILRGFSLEVRKRVVHFSYDREAQLNFQDSYNLFQNDLLSNIGWTVTVNDVKERIRLSKQEFSSVYVEAIRHKNGCLDYLHETLLKKLTSAKTIEEVDIIVWEKPKKDIVFDTSNMLDKKVGDIVEVTKDSIAQKAYNGYTESMLMEVIDIALMGAMG